MNTRTRSAAVVAFCLALGGAAGSAAMADVIYGNAADRTILSLSPPILQDGLGGEVGRNGGIMRTMVIPFQLPARPAGTVVTAADFSVRLLRNMNVTSMNVDLYGLTPRTSSTVLATDAYAGPNDASATRVQDNFATLAMTDINAYVPISTNAGGDAALVNYLNNAYSTVGVGGWVFLRLSCDNASAPNIDFYFVDASNVSLPAHRPQINVTFGVPTPGAAAALALAGAAALRRKRR